MCVFERAAGYVAQAGLLTTLPRLRGAESQKHRTPTVAGCAQAPVEAEVGVSGYLPQSLWRLRLVSGGCRVGVFLSHCAPFMETGTLGEPRTC